MRARASARGREKKPEESHECTQRISTRDPPGTDAACTPRSTTDRLQGRRSSVTLLSPSPSSPLSLLSPILPYYSLVQPIYLPPSHLSPLPPSLSLFHPTLVPLTPSIPPYCPPLPLPLTHSLLPSLTLHHLMPMSPPIPPLPSLSLPLSLFASTGAYWVATLL